MKENDFIIDGGRFLPINARGLFFLDSQRRDDQGLIQYEDGRCGFTFGEGELERVLVRAANAGLNSPAITRRILDAAKTSRVIC